MIKTHGLDLKNIISTLQIVTIAIILILASVETIHADSNQYIDRMPIYLSETTFVYNGTEQYPEVTIDGLTEGTDYTVEYTSVDDGIQESCVEPGEYNVVITGINDGTNGYFGTVLRSFSINKYCYRVFGDNRIETAIKAAELLRDGGTFDTIVLAYSKNYPDALAGSYIAIENDAPILLIDDDSSAKVIDYIDVNLVEGGRVYILGAEGVISTDIEDELIEHGFDTNRLGGSNRYETNLLILNEGSNEAGKPLIICTGAGFADSLSASTSGAPILLVDPKKGLSDEQKEYIEASGINEIIICGGTSAVPESVEKALSTYGDIDRLAGQNRYETSKLVAEEFTDTEASTVFIAYGENFPDGLCAGPLAAKMNAALILAQNSKTAAAEEYVSDQAIGISYIMGGAKLISDDSVTKITGASSIIIK